MYRGSGHKCLSCGKAITWQFAICADCELIFGRTAKEWPMWLVYMWRDYARERRRTKQIAKREVTATDLTLRLALEFQDDGEEMHYE